MSVLEFQTERTAISLNNYLDGIAIWPYRPACGVVLILPGAAETLSTYNIAMTGDRSSEMSNSYTIDALYNHRTSRAAAVADSGTTILARLQPM